MYLYSLTYNLTPIIYVLTPPKTKTKCLQLLLNALHTACTKSADFIYHTYMSNDLTRIAMAMHMPQRIPPGYLSLVSNVGLKRI